VGPQIIQQFTATIGHRHQSAAGVEVLPVDPKVFREVPYSFREDGDLDATGTRIPFTVAKLGYYTTFFH
jgi:hypothetical protein